MNLTIILVETLKALHSILNRCSFSSSFQKMVSEALKPSTKEFRCETLNPHEKQQVI